MPSLFSPASAVDSRSRSDDDELAAALRLLDTICGSPRTPPLLDIDEPPTSEMVYTNGLTLWMLVLQRLGGGKSLNETISHVRDLLPDNKRVRENTLSLNSGA